MFLSSLALPALAQEPITNGVTRPQVVSPNGISSDSASATPKKNQANGASSKNGNGVTAPALTAANGVSNGAKATDLAADLATQALPEPIQEVTPEITSKEISETIPEAIPVTTPEPVLERPAATTEPQAASTTKPASTIEPQAKPVQPRVAAPAAPSLSDLGRSLRDYFTEEELSLLFQYMKESVMASFKDEEVNLPPDLAFKLEILLVRMKKESDHYMDNLIEQLERDLKKNWKDRLKEKLKPPPIKEQPYNPWLKFPWQ